MRETDSGCQIIETPHEADALASMLRVAGPDYFTDGVGCEVGVDVETRPYDVKRSEPDVQRDLLVGVGISIYRHGVKCATYYGLCSPEYLAALRLLEPLPWYAHNALFDCTVLRRYGVRLGELKGDGRIAAYLLGEPEAGLKPLLQRKYGIDTLDFHEVLARHGAAHMGEVPIEAQAEYCGSQDAELCVRLALDMEQDLSERALGIYHVELALVNTLVDMSQTGIAFDRDEAQKRLDIVRANKDGLDIAIRALVERTGFQQWETKDGEPYLRRCESCKGGSKKRLACDRCWGAGREFPRELPFNPGSADQLRAWLYAHMGFPIKRWTLGAEPSTDGLAILQMKTLHPVMKLLFKRRKAAKQSQFLEKWLELSEADGMLHTTFTNTTVVSGRLSSRDPNLQQVTLDYRDLFYAH